VWERPWASPWGLGGCVGGLAGVQGRPCLHSARTPKHCHVRPAHTHAHCAPSRRYIIKQLSRSERQSFLEFGPDYFRYVGTMLHRGQDTCLAKILGVYQVSVQYTGGRGAPAAPPFGGKEGVMDLLVTENVFYGRDAQVRAGVRVLLLAHGSAASGVGEAELCCRAGMRGQRQRLAWGAASRACATRAVRGVTYCTIAVPQVSRIYDLKGSQRDRYAADNPAVAGAVLLDENLKELNLSAPTLVGPRAYARLQRALWSGVCVSVGGGVDGGKPAAARSSALDNAVLRSAGSTPLYDCRMCYRCCYDCCCGPCALVAEAPWPPGPSPPPPPCPLPNPHTPALPCAHPHTAPPPSLTRHELPVVAGRDGLLAAGGGGPAQPGAGGGCHRLHTPGGGCFRAAS
jgi:hypothetical protein